MADLDKTYIQIDVDGTIKRDVSKTPVAGCYNISLLKNEFSPDNIQAYKALDNSTIKYNSFVYVDDRNRLWLSAVDIFNYTNNVTDTTQTNKDSLCLVPCSISLFTGSTVPAGTITIEGLSKKLWKVTPDFLNCNYFNSSSDYKYDPTSGYTPQPGSNLIRESAGDERVVQCVNLKNVDESVTVNNNNVALLTNAQNIRIVNLLQEGFNFVLNIKGPNQSAQTFLSFYNNKKDWQFSTSFSIVGNHRVEENDTTKLVNNTAIIYTGQSDPFKLKAPCAIGLASDYTQSKWTTTDSIEEIGFNYMQVEDKGLSTIMDCILDATSSDIFDGTVYKSNNPIDEYVLQLSSNNVQWFKHQVTTQLMYKNKSVGYFNDPLFITSSGKDAFHRVFDFREYAKFDYNIIVAIKNSFDNSSGIDTTLPLLGLGSYFLKYNPTNNIIEYMAVDDDTIPLFSGGAAYDKNDEFYKDKKGIQFTSNGKLNGSTIVLLTKDLTGLYFGSLTAIYINPIVNQAEPNITSENIRVNKADLILN